MPPFGDKLKKQREKRGITLDDVALTTKIGTRFLRALEEEHFDQLPGGIFNRGFVRAYARCIGLDEDQAVADYLMASGEAQPKKAETAEPLPSPVSKAPAPKSVPKEVLAEKVDNSYADSADASSFPWISVAGFVVVGALGLAIWHFYPRQASTGSTNTTAAVVSPQPSTSVPQTSGTQAASSLPVVPSTVPSSSPAPGAFVVLIKAAEESWMSIKIDDQPSAEYTLEESEQKSIEAHKQVEVKVGNLAGVDFWFNGKKVALQGEEGEVKTLIFDTNGLLPSAPKSPSAGTPTPTP